MNTLSSTGGAAPAPVNSSRQLNLDALRCVSIFFVVVAHAATNLLAYVDTPERWLTGMTGAALGFLSISPLLMITGAMLLSPRAAEREPTPWDCYRKRLPRLAIPLFFWVCVYYVRNHYTMGTSIYLPTFFKRLLTNTMEAHLWYLYMLLGVYIALPFLRAMDFPRRRALGWWYVGISIALHTVNYLCLAVWGVQLYHKLFEEVFPIYMALVVLGWLLHSRPPLPLKWTPVLLATIVLGISGAIGLQYIHTVINGHMDTLYLLHYTPFQLASGISFFLLFKQMPMRLPEFWARRLIGLSACCYGIYLIHILILQFLTGVLTPVFRGAVFPPMTVEDMASRGIPDGLGVFLLSISIFLVSWALTAVIRRIPYLRIIMP
ncbi:acyltransferase [Megalodesulfovibrio paquesii]